MTTSIFYLARDPIQLSLLYQTHDHYKTGLQQIFQKKIVHYQFIVVA